MSRPDNDRVGDILYAAHVAGIIADGGRVAFDADPVARYAAERAIEVMGEAANNLSPEFRTRRPGFDISGMKRMRDLLAHRYHKVDDNQVWEAIVTDIPDLVVGLGHESPIAQRWSQDPGGGITP